MDNKDDRTENVPVITTGNAAKVEPVLIKDNKRIGKVIVTGLNDKHFPTLLFPLEDESVGINPTIYEQVKNALMIPKTYHNRPSKKPIIMGTAGHAITDRTKNPNPFNI